MIDWDLAPEGAVALKQDVGRWKNVTWIHADGSWWDDTDATWNPGISERDWLQTIAVRPVTQTKTVADAVEWAKGEWNATSYQYIVYNPSLDRFDYSKTGDINEKWYKVCTREQFEAYVKEQEQESEKWTHDFYGDRCKILISKPDAADEIVILLENGNYSTVGEDEVKPIKPKRFSVKNGFVYDGDVRMGNSDVVNVLNYMVDKLDR